MKVLESSDSYAEQRLGFSVLSGGVLECQPLAFPPASRGGEGGPRGWRGLGQGGGSTSLTPNLPPGGEGGTAARNDERRSKASAADEG